MAAAVAAWAAVTRVERELLLRRAANPNYHLLLVVVLLLRPGTGCTEKLLEVGVVVLLQLVPGANKHLRVGAVAERLGLVFHLPRQGAKIISSANMSSAVRVLLLVSYEVVLCSQQPHSVLSGDSTIQGFELLMNKAKRISRHRHVSNAYDDTRCELVPLHLFLFPQFLSVLRVVVLLLQQLPVAEDAGKDEVVVQLGPHHQVVLTGSGRPREGEEEVLLLQLLLEQVLEHALLAERQVLVPALPVVVLAGDP